MACLDAADAADASGVGNGGDDEPISTLGPNELISILRGSPTDLNVHGPGAIIPNPVQPAGAAPAATRSRPAVRIDIAAAKSSLFSTQMSPRSPRSTTGAQPKSPPGGCQPRSPTGGAQPRSPRGGGPSPEWLEAQFRNAASLCPAAPDLDGKAFAELVREVKALIIVYRHCHAHHLTSALMLLWPHQLPAPHALPTDEARCQLMRMPP